MGQGVFRCPSLWYRLKSLRIGVEKASDSLLAMLRIASATTDVMDVAFVKDSRAGTLSLDSILQAFTARYAAFAQGVKAGKIESRL